MKTTVVVRGRAITFDDGLLDADREALAGARPAIPLRPARFAAAAAHLVMKPSYRDVPHSSSRPGASEEIAAHVDFDATLAIRRRIASHGFAIAEAMDTAQRFEIGWPLARELIRRTGEARLPHGFIAGAGQDSCTAPGDRDALVAGVVSQCREIQAAGGIVILLPLPVLSAKRLGAADYVDVYRRIVAAIDGPVFLHWLGPSFAPALEGYFPGDSFERILTLDPDKVRGAKLSLLDAAYERSVRRTMLARGQIVLTGDDLHFATLIEGDGIATGTTSIGGRDVPLGEFSHALLGIFDAVAAPAGIALQWLARGDVARYRARMAPLEQLGRVVFEPPVSDYKAGLAFLSWLNGFQEEFLLVNHVESARTVEHCLRAAEIAGSCGAIVDAETAARRIATLESR